MSAPWLADAPTALYRLYDHDGALLYIGITHDPDARWASHASDKPWWPQVVRKDVEWYGSRALAEQAEVAAIKSEPARYNGTHSPWNQPTREPVEGEVSTTEAKRNLTELAVSTRLLSRVAFLTSRGKRQAAIVPVELGELVQRIGGPDKAAEVIDAHLKGGA